MKKSFPLFLSFLCALWASPLSAQTPTAASTADSDLQTITLKDGTVLKGKLAQVEGDSYAVQTPNMGTVKVPVSAVSSITTGQAPAPMHPDAQALQNSLSGLLGGQSAAMPQLGQMGSSQQALMMDPAFLAEVQLILQDENVRKILSDPQLQKDVMTMDPDTIQNNPSIQQLMTNPQMQELMQKMAEKMAGGMQGPGAGTGAALPLTTP
ncbi:MAG: hypothetical protein Q8Q08_00825 [Candidatus Omnitrophota bacterium]|nr:hypothetical protein [Candidatus Omnitrophota bacterium]MDZ4242295.1 hypothetical protein [Candidatus Omnitrophota bacterium]